MALYTIRANITTLSYIYLGTTGDYKGIRDILFLRYMCLRAAPEPEPKVALCTIRANKTTLSFSFLRATGDYKGLEICLHILYFPGKRLYGKTCSKKLKLSFAYYYVLIPSI